MVLSPNDVMKITPRDEAQMTAAAQQIDDFLRARFGQQSHYGLTVRIDMNELVELTHKQLEALMAVYRGAGWTVGREKGGDQFDSYNYLMFTAHNPNTCNDGGR